MTLVPVKDISEYKRVKEALRERFEAERTGDQDLFREQSKIFQPLIDTQKQTVKAIKDGQDASATAVSTALLPFARELQKRNEQVDMLSEQPFYQQEFQAITPISPEFMQIDLDARLNVTDRENLQDMSFELPSRVFKNKIIQETLDKIKTENRSIGQKLGTGPVGQKVDVKEKKVYQSRKQTLETYKDIIEGLEGAKQFVSTPKKVGKGLKGQVKKTAPQNRVDAIYYHSVDDLCKKLCELYAAKQAGHTGLDDKVNSILDELLRVKAICKDEYNELYTHFFH